MIGKRFTILTLVLLSLVSGASAQEQADSLSAKQVFFGKHQKYLTDNGGVWTATDPNYQPDVQYSAKEHEVTFSKGIHGEHLKFVMKSNLNDVGWITNMDGYYLWHPEKEQIIYHALSVGGLISNGSLRKVSAEGQVLLMEILTYEGKEMIYKDTETIIDENTMLNKSYELDSEGQWTLKGEYKWQRKQ